MTNRRVIVVGGGVFGGCAAYELSKAGVNVTLIESDPIGVHASGRNPGNLNPILATPKKLQSLALASFRRHETLAYELSELGCIHYDIDSVRRVMVCFNHQDQEELESVERQFASQGGFSARWLAAHDLRAIDSRLSEDVVAGLLLEGNRSIDALAFNRAIVEGAVKLGAELLAGHVESIDQLGGGNLSVQTSLGNLECDDVVLASGPWVAETRSWFGVNLPVQPVKGEMLRMRLAGANISHDFTYGLTSLYRRRDGEVWVGVTREACGFDEQPSDTGRRILLENAARIMPVIAQAELIEHLASLRPMAPGGLPLIGSLPGHDNVFVANGGGIKGILICAGVGRAIADLMVTGCTDLPVSEFSVQ